MEPLNKSVVMVATESHPIFNIEVGQSIIYRSADKDGKISMGGRISPNSKRGSKDPRTAESVQIFDPKRVRHTDLKFGLIWPSEDPFLNSN